MENLILPDPITRVPWEIKYTPGEELIKSSFTFSQVSSDIIEGYNDIILKQIPKRLAIPFYEDEQIRVWIDDVEFLPPSIMMEGNQEQLMFPMHARTFYRTYESYFRCRVVMERDGEITQSEKFTLGSIPVMLGSVLDNMVRLEIPDSEKLDQYGECPDDTNGYFIIDGTEYVVMIQQQLRYNRFLVKPLKNRKEDFPYFYTGSFKSFTMTKSYSMGMVTNGDNIILLYTDNIPKREGKKEEIIGINIFYVYRVLGGADFSSNISVRDYILSMVPNKSWVSIVTAFLAETTKSVYPRNLSFVDKKTFSEASESMTILERMDFIYSILMRELFPHTSGDEETQRRKKITLLTLSLLKYIYVETGIHIPDDIDSWSSSQATSPGMNMLMFFNQIWNGMTRGKDGINSRIESSRDEINPDMITTYLQQNTSKGAPKFTTSFSKGFRKHSFKVRNHQEVDNATQVLMRKSTLASKVHINRIVIRSQKRGKMINKRQVQMSQTGYVCPSDAQEGEKCGLTKSKAITARITISRDHEPIIQYIADEIMERRVGDGVGPILLDYDFLGWGNTETIVRKIIQGRRAGILERDISVVIDNWIVHILAMPGRLVRPLLVVENGDLVIDKKNLWGRDFKELLEEGAVEYVDAWEQDIGLVSVGTDQVREGKLQQLLIAESINEFKEGPESSDLRRRYNKFSYTHCELDPTSILGIGASLIPLANHNQGPRNSYQCNMSYQALGVYAGNHYYRFDSHAKMLAFPSRPLMETHTSDIFGLQKAPQGQSVIIAIMPFQGLNQEDAIIVKKSAVERGLFTTLITHSKDLVLKSNSEFFTNPLKYLRGNPVADRYAAIGDDGLPRYNSYIRTGDCILGAVRNILRAEGEYEERYEDISLYADTDLNDTIIDRTEVGINSEGKRIALVRLRKYKFFEEGDKMASRHAQKSSGVIVPDVDMPFSVKSGMIPDLIMNPLAIPSRMTVGHIFEILASKYAAMAVRKINGSSWGDFNIDDFKRMLPSFGFTSSGKERMMNGVTGEMIEGHIFIGPCYYQLLSHQVIDKEQARQTGPLQRTTKQAISGRSRGGGIKYGTMELSAFVAHGAIHAAHERLTSSCGLQTVIVCNQCGTNVSATNKMYSSTEIICPRCLTSEHMGVCEVKPSALYLTNYLSAAGIHTGMRGTITK